TEALIVLGAAILLLGSLLATVVFDNEGSLRAEHDSQRLLAGLLTTAGGLGVCWLILGVGAELHAVGSGPRADVGVATLVALLLGPLLAAGPSFIRAAGGVVVELDLKRPARLQPPKWRRPTRPRYGGAVGTFSLRLAYVAAVIGVRFAGLVISGTETLAAAG